MHHLNYLWKGLRSAQLTEFIYLFHVILTIYRDSSLSFWRFAFVIEIQCFLWVVIKFQRNIYNEIRATKR